MFFPLFQQDESHEGSSGLGIKSESDSKPPVVKAENYSSNNDSQVNMALARRASSGTPVSIKSKVSLLSLWFYRPNAAAILRPKPWVSAKNTAI